MSNSIEYVGKYSSIKHLWEYSLRVKEFSRKRIVKYIFFVTLVLWIFVSVYVGYQYVRFSSDRIVAKGGTFVEGIFGTTSYLPYLNNDQQARFYQSFLFNSCVNYQRSGNTVRFISDFCTVKTQDHKNFTVSFLTGKVWSDGTPVSIDDVLFTYSKIIQQNKWKIPLFEQYSAVEISQNSSSSIKVTFPQASIDNQLLFTYAILPNHVLTDATLEEYQTLFATRPIYSNCARIKPQSSDPYSLIFDVTECKDTYLSYFQIKNVQNFDSFRTITEKDEKTIVDIYEGNENIKGFERFNILSHQYLTVFFNTASDKLRVRTRRSLAGLIMSKIYEKDDFSQLFQKDNWLFQTFLSTGSYVKDFLSQLSYARTGLSKKDIVDAGVKILPDTISATVSKKSVFYVEEGFTQKRIIGIITGDYDSLYMLYNGKETSLSSYDKKNKKFDYLVSVSAKTLTGGLNKYIVYGKTKDGKKEGIMSIDIYYLQKNTVGVPQENKISVLFYHTPLSEYIVKRLEEIFAEAGVLEYFSFEGFGSYEEMEGRILTKNYDIVITSIDMGLKQDMSNMFSTDKSQINPSQYINTNFVTQLQMYLYTKDSNIYAQIQDMYSKDMPFVVIGQQYIPLHVKNEFAKELLIQGNMTQGYWRQAMYHNLRLVKNVHFDRKKMRNIDNFFNFIGKMISK